MPPRIRAHPRCAILAAIFAAIVGAILGACVPASPIESPDRPDGSARGDGPDEALDGPRTDAPPGPGDGAVAPDAWQPWCGDGTCSDDESSLTCPQDCGPVSTPTLVAAIFTRLNTCVVGDPCHSGTCIAVTRRDGTVVHQFQDNDAFRTLKPSDPALDGYPNRVCVALTIPPDGIAAVHAAATGASGSFAEQVATASGGRMRLAVTVLEVGEREVALSKWGATPWLAPWNAREHLSASVTRATDGVIAIHSTSDSAQDLIMPLQYCGGTDSAEWGIGGAGYSWIPYSDGYWFQCATAGVMFHEWLHQVDWALRLLMSVSDCYTVPVGTEWRDQYPACGHGGSDTHAWFPSSDFCLQDPDWVSCGLADCGDGDAWNAHVLAAHYDFARPYVGNHCRDRVSDYGETAVDTGGECPAQ